METKQQVGTLVVTERSVKTTYPVYKAIYGVLKYTDTTEIWFLVSAGTAISNPHDDTREPRLAATFYDKDLDPDDLSNPVFDISPPAGLSQRPPLEAQFYYFAHPGKPADFSSGRIQFQEAVGESYQVRWTATLDSYNSRPKPGSQIDVELNATFRPESVIDVPGTRKEADFNQSSSWHWLMFPILLVGSLLGAIFPMFPGYWLLLFFGTFLGFVIADILSSRKYQKIVRAMESQQRKPESSNQAEPDIAGGEK